MGLRHRQGRSRKRGGRIGSLGLVLALLALLSQSLVLLLPVPAMAMSMPMEASAPLAALPADAALFEGGYILCQDEDGAPVSDHDKTPCQHCVDCPLCQAFHGPAGGLVPPTAPALPLPVLQPVTFTPATVADHELRLVARAHQPRAPPSIVRF